MPTNGDSNPRSRLIDAAIAEYLQAIERGVPLDRPTFLADHADIADELREFLADDGSLRRQAPQPESGSEATTDNPAEPIKRMAATNGAALDVLRYFGDYELVEEIARGGMGVVYKARQTTLNRTVAVKMILAGQLASQDEIDRFYAEAQSAATLDHPNIVPIFEVGQHQGQHYFSMGYVTGQSLAQRLAAGPLAPRDAATIIRDVALAVHYAHRQGVIHRDLKPANILFDADGHPRITDFGLAKRQADAGGLTATGQVLGTPSYMPPEQISGRNGQIGPAVDVYSLGATLYALLTGRPPFQAASVIDTLKQVLEKDPVPLREFDASVARDLETITLKCLEKAPSRRYTTAKDLADDLDRYVTGRPILARPVGRTERAWRWCCRNPIVASLASAVLLLLLVVAVVGPIEAVLQATLRRQADRLVVEKQQIVIQLDKKNTDLIEQLAQNLIERAEVEYQAGRVAPGIALLVGAYDTVPKGHRIRLGALNLMAGWEESAEQPIVTGSTIAAAAFSPDGRTIVTAGYDSTAQLWDAHSLLPIGKPLQHKRVVYSVAFSPDSSTLVTSSGDTVAHLWDVRSGKQIGEPLYPKSLQPPAKGDLLTSSVAFSPDSKRVLVGGYVDDTARVWDVASGEEIGKPLQNEGRTDAVAWSADGTFIVTAGNGNTLRIWDAHTEQPIGKSFGGIGVGPNAVAISPDSTTILISHRSGIVTFWDASTHIKQPTELKLHPHFFGSAAFSPDGATVLTGNEDSKALLWTRDGTPAGEPLEQQGRILAVGFSPDGENIITGGDRVARLWRRFSGKRISGKPVVFSRNGSAFFTVRDNAEVQFWDARTEEPRGKPIPIPNFSKAKYELSPDGRRFLTATSSNVQLWDTIAGESIGEPLRLDSEFSAAAFAPDGRTVLTSSLDLLRLWDAETGRPIREPLKHGISGINYVWGRSVNVHFGFDFDGSTVLVQDGEMKGRLLDIQSWKFVGEPIEFGASNSTKFSPTEHTLAVEDNRHFVQLLDARTRQPICPPLQHKSGLSGWAFSSDGGRLMTGTFDGLVQWWDARTGHMLGDPLQLPSGSRSLVLSNDNLRLLVGNNNLTAQLWDPRTGEPLTVAMHHSEDCFPMFSDEPGTVLTKNGRDKVWFWDTYTGKSLATPLCRGGQVSVSSVDAASRAVLTWNSTTSEGRLWKLPVALPDDSILIHKWVRARTGYELDVHGVLHTLSQDEWLAAQRELQSMKTSLHTGF